MNIKNQFYQVISKPHEQKRHYHDRLRIADQHYYNPTNEVHIVAAPLLYKPKWK